MDGTFTPWGADLFGGSVKPTSAGVVADRFIMPPFSVLDARQGDWQERKRAWIALGIKSEVGREATSYSLNGTNGAKYDYLPQMDTGTSIFDPVLTELCVRWFSAPGSQIVDPFAGGSVRGIVSTSLDRSYWGCDLRDEQVIANRLQRDSIETPRSAVWQTGDAIQVLEHAPTADLILTCPPYGDLERYSDDPKDLSTMEWHTFAAAYRRIVHRCVQRMAPNSFAVWIVGNFRDKRGFMRDLVGLTVQAHEEQSVPLYNEAVLVTAVGTAAFRVTKQFMAGRKLCKTHQNVLVFCKGDPKQTAAIRNAEAQTGVLA